MSGIAVARFTFVPSVEQHQDDPGDLVFRFPMNAQGGSSTVRFFQTALGVQVWSWKQGGWNNLTEALEDGLPSVPHRLVIKQQGVPRKLSDDDLSTYLDVISNFLVHEAEQGTTGRLVALFPEKARAEIERMAAQYRGL